MIDRLELELTALGRELDLPETPDLVQGTLARLDRRPRTAPRRRLRVAFVILAALLLPVGVALAVSGELRDQVREWLGVDAVVVEEVETLPPVDTDGEGRAPWRSEASLTVAPAPVPGRRVTLATARQAAGFGVRVPETVGPPSAVYLAGSGRRARVSLAWSPRPGLPRLPGTRYGLLVTVLRGDIDYAIVKQVVNGTTRRFLTVGGAQGFALLGPPHTVRFVDVDGNHRRERTRLAANTLLVSKGGLLARIEAKAPLATLVGVGETYG